MKQTLIPLVSLLLGASLSTGLAASIFDIFKRAPAANSVSLASLSNEQIVSGLKEALAKGVTHAVTNLGRPDGFLKDAQVKIPMPEPLLRVDKTLRMLQQGQLADEFVATMNHAAEQAVPQAAVVLVDSVKQMSLADAKAILTSTNTAATDYFRRTSQTTLHDRFLPIVKEATAKTGVTAAYKRMTEGAHMGEIGTMLLGLNNFDLDEYITRKSLDGLFVKIAEQEKLIRENPVARTTELLQKVFGAIGK